MLEFHITGLEELKSKGENFARKVNELTYKKMVFWAGKVERKVKEDKLSGQVLNRVTGALSASISNSVSPITNGVYAKIFSSGDVKYAGIHEFGGVINHPGGTAYVFGSNGMAKFITNAKAEAMKSVMRTRPHLIPIPARPYLRPSLMELWPEIKEDLSRVPTEALQG